MPDILLWTNAPGPYAKATTALSADLRFGTLPRAATPTPRQRASAEIWLGWDALTGLPTAMPRLAWVQALTEQVDPARGY